MSIMKKIQVDENDCEYMSFRNYIYSTECFLAVEIYEKGHADRDLIFEEKRQKAQEKKLRCKFIRLNTSNAKNDCEVGNVQAFINEFNDKKIKKLEKKKKRKRTRRKIRKRTGRKIRKRNERKIRKITKRKSRKKTKRKIKKRS